MCKYANMQICKYACFLDTSPKRTSTYSSSTYSSIWCIITDMNLFYHQSLQDQYTTRYDWK